MRIGRCVRGARHVQTGAPTHAFRAGRLRRVAPCAAVGLARFAARSSVIRSAAQSSADKRRYTRSTSASARMTSALSTTPLFSRLSTTSSRDASELGRSGRRCVVLDAWSGRGGGTRRGGVAAASCAAVPAAGTVDAPCASRSRLHEDYTAATGPVRRRSAPAARQATAARGAPPRGTSRATSRSRETRHRGAAAHAPHAAPRADRPRATAPRAPQTRRQQPSPLRGPAPAPRHARVFSQREMRCRSSRAPPSALRSCLHAGDPDAPLLAAADTLDHSRDVAHDGLSGRRAHALRSSTS